MIVGLGDRGPAIVGPGGPIILLWTARRDHFCGGTAHGATGQPVQHGSGDPGIGIWIHVWGGGGGGVNFQYSITYRRQQTNPGHPPHFSGSQQTCSRLSSPTGLFPQHAWT